MAEIIRYDQGYPAFWRLIPIPPPPGLITNLDTDNNARHLVKSWDEIQ